MSIVKLNNRGVRSASTFGSITSLGSMVFIKKQTASSSSTISFVDGTSDVVLDDTYKEYLFTFKDIHPATDSTDFSFQGNVAGGSGYNETITSSFFRAYHGDDDGGATLAYYDTLDQAQGTGFQALCENVGNDNDSQLSGMLHLFNPSNTTFVTHFMARTVIHAESDYAVENYIAGYFNTTSAIDEIQFKMDSGNIDAGDICLYGIN
jgi:hypothetical protein